MAKIAIIGAGLSGLVVAREFDAQHDVVVFEKSRGVGGRMATRYADDFEFDHGTQFFTARTAAFQAFLEPLAKQGIVSHWDANFAEFRGSEITATRRWDAEYPHYVGVPRMSALGKHLARGLNVQLGTRIGSLQRADGSWTITDTQGANLGSYDWVVMTPPSAQTAELAPADSTIGSAAVEAPMRACCALMLGFTEPLELGWTAALVRNADISWVSVNSSKPGRLPRPTLVVHSTNRWADAHFEDDPAAIIEHLRAETERVTGIDTAVAAHCNLQRWRYANADKRAGPVFSLDVSSKLAACGDWFIRGRVEAAFTSANALVAALRPELDG